MGKIISVALISIMLFSGIAFCGEREVPPEVPPCPEEYQDGLRP